MTAEEFLKSEGYNFKFYGTTAALLDKYAAIKIGENMPAEWPVAPRKSTFELFTQSFIELSTQIQKNEEE